MIVFLAILGLFLWDFLGTTILVLLAPDREQVARDTKELDDRLLLWLLGFFWPIIVLGVFLHRHGDKIPDPTKLPVIFGNWLLLRWVILKERFQ